MQRLFPENNLVPPQMGPSLRLVVGEAPGENEALEGIPLVGGSGKMFNALATKAGVQREELSVLNTINCRPPENVYPTDAAARSYITTTDANLAQAHCINAFLKPTLESRPWTRIDAIGDKALNVLTGETGITKWRGSPLALKGETETRVIPTLHPAYLMRFQELIPAVISDLKKSTHTPPEFYDLHPTLESLEKFIDSSTLCFDIETNRFTNTITMVGLSIKPTEVSVVPFTGAYISILKRIFISAKRVIGQNLINFDIPHLEENSIKFHPEVEVHDVMLMQHLLQPDMPHDLEFIVSVWAQKPAWKHLSGENKELYCARDVDGTFQAWENIYPTLRSKELLKLYENVQIPLTRICKMMHDTGIKQDPNRVKVLRDKFEIELKLNEETLPVELRAHDIQINKRVKAPLGTLGKSGKPVKFIHEPAFERITPWNSPKTIEKWLYETLALPKQLHPKTKKLTTDKCLDPKTRVLTASLEWVQVEKLLEGDVLLAFDESNNGRSGRKLRLSKIIKKATITEPRYKITTNKGSIISSELHGFLAQKYQTSNFSSRYEWKMAKDLKVGDTLSYFVKPWELDTTREGGWLAGILNGEGSLSGTVSIFQNKGDVLNSLHKILNKKGYQFSVYPKAGGFATEIRGVCSGIDLIGATRPVRFIEKFIAKCVGRRVYGKQTETASILAIEPLGNGDVIALQTESKTIIAEGFLTHNSALERLIRRCTKDGKPEIAKQIGSLQKVRQLDELLSTFLKHDDKTFVPITIHANFLPHGTATGRLASSNPNMQNIPAKSRFIYVPPFSGWCFVEADFSSLENRLAAWYANDTERLGRLSVPGFNEHKWLTSKLYNIPEEEVDKEGWQYKRGKNTNHGADGAMGPRKLSMTYDIPLAEATELLSTWRKINHKSAEWQETTGNKASREGVLTNAFGRKRWFWTQTAYTEGIRFLPQSTGADICFRAMIALLYERINFPPEKVLESSGVLAPLPQPAQLVLQVHDSLLVACPEHLVPNVVQAMKLAMEQPWAELGGLIIPAAFKVGTPNASWGELEPYKG